MFIAGSDIILSVPGPRGADEPDVCPPLLPPAGRPVRPTLQLAAAPATRGRGRRPLGQKVHLIGLVQGQKHRDTYLEQQQTEKIKTEV